MVKQKITKEEAEFYSWKETIGRTPSYFGTTQDLKVHGVPIYLWEKLSEVCPPVKAALEERDKKVNEFLNPSDKEGIKEEEFVFPTLDSQLINDGFLKIMYNDRGQQTRVTVEVENIANHFIEEEDLVSVEVQDKEFKLYYYNGKYYEYGGKTLIKTKFEELLKEYAKNNPLKEVLSKIERKRVVSKEEFETTDINLIPLENGVWDIDNKKLIPHSPNRYFKTIIPITYKADEDCKVWLKFLEESLYLEDIDVLQEWFGFCLYREYLIKKALVCLGQRDTGKTVLLEVLTEFIGDKNKTGLSLQKIGSGSDFTKLSLKDKHANIYDDLSSQDINDGGNFKIATGGGNISGEEKFGAYCQFRNYAKHTFATNKIPPVKDNDDMAYFSRWIVLRMNNQPEKKDLFLKKKIFKEKSGILNWALDGLYRLLENGEFSYNKTPEEVKQIMEMSGDPLIQFGDEVLERSDSKITKEDMYEVYSIWANEFDKPMLSKEQLGRRLNQKIKYLVPKKSDTVRFWDNVKLKDNWVEKLENSKNDDNRDTLDTFRKTMRNDSEGKKDASKILYIKSGKVSKVPKDFTKDEIEKAGYTQEELSILSGEASQ